MLIMGCHTWFYRKIERTQEEAKQSCLRKLKQERNLCWKIYKNPTGYLGVDWNTTKNEQLDYISKYNRKIKAVANGFYKRAVWNNQNDKEITIYIDGRGLFIEDTGFHDLFRKGGYPDDILFSLEETLNYINSPNNDCSVYPTTNQRLDEFWKKYPNGLIEFG